MVDAGDRSGAPAPGVGEFLALVSALEPEVRGPVRALLSSADAVLDVYSDEQRRQLVATVKEAARVLERRLVGLCDVAAALAGSAAVEHAPVPLRSALVEAAIVARSADCAAGITVGVTTPEDVVVAADRRRLVDLLAELFIAAAYTIDDSTRLYATARAVGPASVNVVLTPTGASASDARARWHTVFDRPPAAAPLAVRRRLGTMRLWALAQSVGAELTVLDVPVSLALHLSLPPLRAAPPPEPRPLPPRARVLVVHTGGRSLRAAVDDLTAAGAQVFEASTHDAACEWLRRAVPVALVLEHAPTGESALALARHVRRLPTIAHAPIVLVAHDLSDDAVEHARRVADAILLWPLRPRLVSRTVGGLLGADRRATRRPPELG
jgi:hypothetical protein